MIVLGLDQAPKGSGWAVGDGSTVRPVQWGYKEFPDYGENESELTGFIIDWLRNLIKSSGAEAVYTEQIILDLRHPNIPVLILQASVIAAVAVTCNKHFCNVPHFQAEISSWRKRAGIVGPDWKDAAIRWCALTRNVLTSNHHIAEAVGVWHFGLCELDASYRARADVELRRAQHQKSLEGV